MSACDGCEAYQEARHDVINALQVLVLAIAKKDWEAVEKATELLYRVRDRR